MGIRTVASKMKKHKALMANRKLRSHLPDTQWLSRSQTDRMIKFYSTAFIKPVGGTGGTGIIRARKVRKGYEVRCGGARRVVPHDKLYSTIRGYRKSGTSYIIQRGIPLGSYKGSLFDLRIYMQKPRDKWIMSGRVARVAAPNRFITNYHKGGHALIVEKALSHLFSNKRSKVNACIKQLEQVSFLAASALDRRFPGIRTLGLDLGIQRNGHVWIIEANTRPMHILFKKLRDKSMLRTIERNKRIIRKLYR